MEVLGSDSRGAETPIEINDAIVCVLVHYQKQGCFSNFVGLTKACERNSLQYLGTGLGVYAYVVYISFHLAILRTEWRVFGLGLDELAYGALGTGAIVADEYPGESYIVEHIPAVMFVSIYPGAIALTRIPVGPNSAARALVRPEF